MDQSAFAGVGNIYRREILNVARVHPEAALLMAPSSTRSGQRRWLMEWLTLGSP